MEIASPSADIFERLVSVDTETRLIGRGYDIVPELVCVSVATNDGVDLFHHSQAEPVVRHLLEHCYLVGANFAGFDLPVFLRRWPHLDERICRALRENRIWDVLRIQQYLDLARGELGGHWTGEGYEKQEYSLDGVHRLYGLGGLDKGEDSWRLRYGELIATPVCSWPEAAVKYAVDDALAALRVFQAQVREGFEGLQAIPLECRAEFFLKMQTWTGLHTDKNAIDKYIIELKESIDKARDLLLLHKLVEKTLKKGVVHYKKNTKPAKELMRNVCESMHLPLPKTEANDISLSADATRDTGHPVLKAYTLFGSASGVLTRAEKLYEGTGGKTLQTEYVVINSNGRTSSRTPKAPAVGENFQNYPRGGKLRECFIPEDPENELLCSVDYSMMELHTVAQCEIWLTGKSLLANALNNKIDVHCMVAAQLLGCSYEEVVASKKKDPYKKMRQQSKEVNFGGWGGMGPDTLMQRMNMKRRDDEDPVDLRETKRIMQAWRTAWSPWDYFNAVKAMFHGDDSTTTMRQFVTGRLRGQVTFTETSNGVFSGLAVDIIKMAISDFGEACLLARPGDLLHNVRPVLYVHDEVISRVPKSRAHEVALEKTRIMLEKPNLILTDVPVRAEPCLMQRWYKDAEAVYDSNKKLIAWEPNR